MAVNEKSLDNLNPAQPGEVRNPNGRPKGSKNLATLIRELEDDDFDWSLVPIKQKEVAKKFGAPWKAIRATAIAQAYSGDARAREWLRKSAYGDKLTVETDTGFFSPQVQKIQIEIIEPKHDIDGTGTDTNANTDTSTGSDSTDTRDHAGQETPTESSPDDSVESV